VAGIVIGISSKLGMAAIHALMDGTPDGVTEKIQAAVEWIEGVCAWRRRNRNMVLLPRRYQFILPLKKTTSCLQNKSGCITSYPF